MDSLQNERGKKGHKSRRTCVSVTERLLEGDTAKQRWRKKSYEWESGTALKWKAVSVFLTKARKNINSKDMSPWQQRKARAWNKSNQGLCVCMCEWDMSSTLLGNILTQWGNTQTAVLWKWVQLSGVNLLGGNQTFLEAIWTILHVSGALSSRFLWII